MSPSFIKFTYIWLNNLRYVKRKNRKLSFKIFILPPFGLCHTALIHWNVYCYCKTNNPNHVITKHLWHIHSCYLHHVFTCVRQKLCLVALMSDPIAFKATWLVTLPETCNLTINTIMLLNSWEVLILLLLLMPSIGPDPAIITSNF